MAGPFQAVFFRTLSDPGPPVLNTGWSEIWYPKGADLTTATNNAKLIHTAVSNLQANSVKYSAIRLSDMSIKGDMTPVAPAETAGTYQGGGPPPVGVCDPDVSLRFRVIGSDPTVHGTRPIRGLPVTLITHLTQLLITTDNEFSIGLANLLTVCTTNAQFVRKLGGIPPQFKITDIATAVYPNVGSPKATGLRRTGRPFGLRRGRRGP
jgi:hypothetical protein